MVEHPVCIREIGVRFPSGPPKTPPEYSGGGFDVETLYLREAANLFAAGKGVGETQFPRVGNQRTAGGGERKKPRVYWERSDAAISKARSTNQPASKTNQRII